MTSTLTPDFIGASDIPNWAKQANRWAQVAFVEDDPANYDPQFWLDYFKRVHAEGALLSAGGCVAFYPTQIEFHYRSAWMGDSDPFGDLVKGCREMGMALIARTDPHSIRQDAYEAHPEWVHIMEDGTPRRHWADPTRWVTCALGPYNFEFMTDVTKEIVELYGVDAIFSNRWSGHGLCYCEHCQRNFRDAYGMELPRTTDPNDPAYRNYLIWRHERLFELWDLWESEIRKINPEGRYIPNTGGGALAWIDMKRAGRKAVTMVADRQSRGGLMPPWAAGKNGKEYRAVLDNKPVIYMFGVGIEGREYRWKNSVQHEPELRIWAADSIANGMRPLFIKFALTLHDHRWLPVIEDIFNWHDRIAPYLCDQKPLARVGLVYSQQTASYYGGPQAREKVEEHLQGYYHALVEARIPFEMVHEKLLDAEHIDQFKVLILPNIAALSDEQCEQLRAYVARGGSLVVTHETSLYDEWGQPRDDFALADLLGVHLESAVEGPVKNSYLTLNGEPGTRHPILKGMDYGDRIINGGYRVGVRAAKEFPDPPLTLVPAYPDLPMEEVYPRQPKTDIPEVYLQDNGSSRIVYFPWDISRIFWEFLNVDHGKLLANAVEWAANEQPPASVTGPGVLDVTVWQQPDSLTVHLVNLTNPNMMRGPFRELLPVGEQEVLVQLPEGKQAKRVKLLRSGLTPDAEIGPGYVKVTVPQVVDHEIVAIDL